MMRFSLGLLLLLTPLVHAADPAGNWRMSIPVQGDPLTFLLEFTQEDDKWSGNFLDSAPNLPFSPTFESVTVDGDHLRFTLKLGNRLVSFDGKIPTEGDVIPGSFEFIGQTLLIDLERSKLKKLDNPFALAREQLDGPEREDFFDVGLSAIREAADSEASVEDVRQVADLLAKRATRYGPRWEKEVAMRLTKSLAEQEGFAEVAVEQARRAERMLDPRTEIDTQLEVLGSLAEALKAAEKSDELGDVQKRIDLLIARDYLAYSRANPPFKPEKFTGKVAEGRTVLVEAFTGSNCPPCAGSDLACDALRKTFNPSDVIVLQNQMHFAGPDPLANRASEERLQYYAEQIEGSPTILFNGQDAISGGGPKEKSEELFNNYREQVTKLLQTPAADGLKFDVNASRKDNTITIKANVSGAKDPEGKLVLRLALAENRVRYAGNTGIRYHHMVLRDLPGGPAGFPLEEGAIEKEVTVELEKVQESLDQYLALASRQFFQDGVMFPKERPTDLGELTLIAFVQNDETKEILQTKRIELK